MEQKESWEIVPMNGSIREVGMFSENAVQFPVGVFMNKETGEVKLYSEEAVKRFGTDAIIKKLNEK